MSSVGIVAASAGGVETLRTGLVQPLIDDGHQVGITLTPTAATWLDHLGEVEQLESLTGLPVRSTPRLPSDPKPHPKSDVLVGAPMTANSVAKLALGIADNQALTVLCECVATVPMIVFPRVNAAHARQPAWTTTSIGSAQSASNSSTANTSGPSRSPGQRVHETCPGQRFSAPSSATSDRPGPESVDLQTRAE